uniref:Uncharacterized protein n=1 Tax=Arundo donax TaxID=35708 RepID=A0A0A9EKJ4_ARUDO
MLPLVLRYGARKTGQPILSIIVSTSCTANFLRLMFSDELDHMDWLVFPIRMCNVFGKIV